MVFNGLFGGFPHSKLFLNVREKHSLAYYASSSVEPFRGLLTVQTGIDGKNREKVLRLVNDQLKEIAEQKIVNMNAVDIAGAMLTIDGTARQMWVTSDIHGMSIEDVRAKLGA